MRHNPVDRPARELGGAVHGEIHRVEHENAAVEGAHKAEQLGERAGGYAVRKVKEGYRSHKLKPYRAAAKAEDAAFKANINVRYGQALRDNPQLAGANPLSKALQKRKIRKEYAKAVRSGTARGAHGAAATAKKTAQNATKAAQKTAAFAARHWKVILIAVAAILILVLLFAGLSSCGAMLQGGFTSIIGTSYTAEDETINAVDRDYSDEIGLRRQIDNIRVIIGYDEYRYFVDEIGHDPFELANYLTAKYHDYTRESTGRHKPCFPVVHLSIQEVVEVRYHGNPYRYMDRPRNRRNLDTYTVEVPYNCAFNVTLKNKSLGASPPPISRRSSGKCTIFTGKRRATSPICLRETPMSTGANIPTTIYRPKP